jgi:hypothetical protein
MFGPKTKKKKEVFFSIFGPLCGTKRIAKKKKKKKDLTNLGPNSLLAYSRCINEIETIIPALVRAAACLFTYYASSTCMMNPQ